MKAFLNRSLRVTIRRFLRCRRFQINTEDNPDFRFRSGAGNAANGAPADLSWKFTSTNTFHKIRGQTSANHRVAERFARRLVTCVVSDPFERSRLQDRWNPSTKSRKAMETASPRAAVLPHVQESVTAMAATSRASNA